MMPGPMTTGDLLAALLADGSSLSVSDTLLNKLAETALASPPAALAALKAAVDEAELLKTLGTLTKDSPDYALLGQVADLNDQGLCDEAAALIARADPSPTVTEIAERQDRIRHAPADTAKRLLAALRAVPHASGLFKAIHYAWEEWFDRGALQGLPFDLTVALHLARANADRAKGVQHAQALGDLGITQFRLAEVTGNPARLTQCIATFRAFLVQTPRKRDPENWAAGMVNLGIALSALGRQTPNPAALTEAAAAFRAALQVQTASSPDHTTTTAHLAEVMAALPQVP